MASLVASIARVGSNSLLSRILGFVRDLVVARVFGADAGTDAFFVAFKIPNLMRRLFAEGAFSLALVPVLNDYKDRQGFPALKGFVDDMAGTLGAALLILTAVGVLAAPLLVLAFAPGFALGPESSPGQRELAAELTRLTFPYVLFVTLTAFAGAILNTYERFGVPAFTPVLLNLTLIAFALLVAPGMERPVVGLALGVLVAGLAQLVFQVPFLMRLRLLPRPRWRPGDPGVRRTLRLMGPALLGSSVGQINLLLDTVLASFLAAGSISWLYYSDRLMELPMGVLGVALGTVILPRLARRHAAQDAAAFSQTLDWGLRWLLLFGVPAAVALATLAGPIAATLFYSGQGTSGAEPTGAFTARDAQMTARSIAAYAPGLVGFIGVKILAPGFYARQQVAVPVRIALWALLSNLVLSLCLMLPLGHAGLALATSLAALLNAALLFLGLLRDSSYRPQQGWIALLAKTLGASVLMGLLLVYGTGDLDGWLTQSTGERVLRLGLWILAGGGLYAATLVAAGIRPRHLMET